MKYKPKDFWMFYLVTIFSLVFWLTTAAAFGQTTDDKTATTQTTKTTAPMPIWKDYKGIAIGATADEVRDKLGKAEIDDKDGFYYEISDDEMAQIRLDADKKVRFVSITYTDKNKNAPKFEDVLGTDTGITAKADGSIYHLVRYPEAGFWVAYSRTAGDKPTVTVTMQKL